MCTVSIPFDPEADGPGYLYVKLADYLTDRIHDDTLPAGAMLPCERSLAIEHGVSVGTARRATHLLRDRGLVVTLPSRGTFVVPRGRPPDRVADREASGDQSRQHDRPATVEVGED
jgi:GntR family transcriptional regulator